MAMSVLLLNATSAEIPLKAGSVHMIATSPPYYGLRDYKLPGTVWSAVEFVPMAGLPAVTVPAWEGCLGMEPDPLMFVAHVVHIMREGWRVLRDDGTAWLNFGDSYAANTGGPNGYNDGRKNRDKRSSAGIPDHLKPKDLMGIPWRIAFALQADGWYLRSDVIWAKGSPMPESVTDRPSKSHEYIFLLAKRQRYFFDHVAVKETAVGTGGGPFSDKYADAQPDHGGESQYRKGGPKGRGKQSRSAGSSMGNPQQDSSGGVGGDGETRNKRSVWNVNPQPYPGAHFATWPPDLVQPMIKSSTSEKGVCPVCGAPWVRVVEKSQPQPRPDNPNPVRPYGADSGFQNGTGATTLHMTRVTETTDWRPSCKCRQEVICEQCDGLGGGTFGDCLVCNGSGRIAVTPKPVPAVVLDIFAGSGTTLQVARQLGRHGIGLDLSFSYLKNEARTRLELDALEALQSGTGMVQTAGRRKKKTNPAQMGLL